MRLNRILLMLIGIIIFSGGCGIKNAIVKKPIDNPVILVSEINPNISTEKLKRIIIASCSKYGWKIISSTNSSVTATLDHMGKESVTIEIPFSSTKIEFVYKSSRNMRYDGTKIHRSYNRWLKSIEIDIRNSIATSR